LPCPEAVAFGVAHADLDLYLSWLADEFEGRYFQRFQAASAPSGAENNIIKAENKIIKNIVMISRFTKSPPFGVCAPKVSKIFSLVKEGRGGNKN